MSRNGAPGPDDQRTGFNFSTFFIKNPVTTLVIMTILVVLGMTSFFKLPLKLFPNMEFPIVVIQAVYPGAAPVEIETLVTKPIEDAVAGINGIDELHSTSMDGVSMVTVVETLDKAIADLSPKFPAGIKITKASHTSHFVKMSNEAVWEHLTIGAILAILVLFVFLRSITAMLIARTLTPMLAAYILKVKVKKGHKDHLEGDLTGRYPRLLRWCLSHRWVVVAVAVLTFAGGMSLKQFVQKGFLSSADREEFLLRIQMPKGTLIGNTIETADKVAAEVRQYPGVRHVITMIGTSGNVDEARLDVLLVPKDERKLSDAKLAKQIREDLSRVPGYKVMADELSLVAGNNKPVDVQLQGDSLDELKVYSVKLVSLMAAHPMFADLETSLGDEKSEVRIFPDRVRMAQLGITAAALAGTLRLATTGETPSTMTAGASEVDVWVRLDPAFRKIWRISEAWLFRRPRARFPCLRLPSWSLVAASRKSSTRAGSAWSTSRPIYFRASRLGPRPSLSGRRSCPSWICRLRSPSTWEARRGSKRMPSRASQLPC